MGPANPLLTNVGKLPLWSMCACDKITESIDRPSTGRLRFFASASFRRPWYMPQSRRTRLPPASTRCIDPVTVPAAPQKVSFIDRNYNRLIAEPLEVLLDAA